MSEALNERARQALPADLQRRCEEFRAVLRRLRKECPWDRKQTWQTLRTQTIEEVHELADALLGDDPDAVRKELGDVLLHVAFYALIAEEQGLFTLADVLDSLCGKLIYRHPHVYGPQRLENADQVVRKWEELKAHEADNKGVLGGVASSLPALVKAFRVQQKVAAVGFDFRDAHTAWTKVREEADEFMAEVDNKHNEQQRQEFGDLLFALVNVGRLLGINPEDALEGTNRKFIRRFNHIEAAAKEQGRTPSQMSLEEMDALWDEAKALERKQSTQQ